MNKYNIFLTSFVICLLTFIFFMVFFMNVIFSLALHADELDNANSTQALSILFNAPLIITAVILGISSLVYRIIGIVYVAGNKTVSDGEKALWIIGFIIMGFITAILFLILAKGKKLVD